MTPRTFAELSPEADRLMLRLAETLPARRPFNIDLLAAEIELGGDELLIAIRSLRAAGWVLDADIRLGEGGPPVSDEFWLRTFGREMWLSEKGVLAVCELKARRDPPDLSGSASRHMLTLAASGWSPRDALEAANLDVDPLLDQLIGMGHVGPDGESFTAAGRAAGERELAAALKLQKPSATSFSRRWRGLEREAHQLIAWAWQQVRGDLTRAFDARAYARTKGRSRHEVTAVLDWAEKQGLVVADASLQNANHHALQFWDRPVNQTLPYGLFYKLTPASEALGARLAAEHRGRWRRRMAHVAQLIVSTNGVVLALVSLGAIAVGLAGFILGRRTAPARFPELVQPDTPPATQPAKTPGTDGLPVLLPPSNSRSFPLGAE